MDNKAQGALEYLLLIGGAVLVAVVVIALLSGLASTAGDGTEENITKGTDAIGDLIDEATE
jgi:uncharacterized protein (UPF0333 family)